MGIEQYATSLISDARKRKKDDSKNELKSTLGLAFGTLIGKSVKSGIESNLEIGKEKFLKNEELMATKLKYKSAVDNSASFLTDQTAINESGETASEYFYGQMEPAFKERTLQEMPTTISGEERLFSTAIRSSLMPLAEKRAAEHEKGLLLAQNLDTYENFKSSYAEQIKNLKPTNIIDAAVSSASRLFSGKTKAEQEQEVVKAIQTSEMNKSAIAMAAFNERYKETKNVITSFEYATAIAAEDIQKIADEDKDIVTSTTSVIKALGDNIGKVTTVSTTDNITGEKTSKESVVLDDSFDDPAGDSLKAAQGMSQVTNLESVPRSVLTPVAYAAYTKEVQNMKLSTANITSAEEYSQVASIFVNYGSDLNNLKDKFKEDTYIASLGTFRDNNIVVERMERKLKRMTDRTSPEFKTLKEELSGIYKSWAVAATEFTEQSLAVLRKNTSIPANPNKMDAKQYRGLSPAAQAIVDNLTPEEFKLKYGQ